MNAEAEEYLHRAAALLASPEERQQFLRSVASRLAGGHAPTAEDVRRAVRGQAARRKRSLGANLGVKYGYQRITNNIKVFWRKGWLIHFAVAILRQEHRNIEKLLGVMSRS
jgi:hypothetical protein